MSQAAYSSTTDGINDVRNTMRAPSLAQQLNDDVQLERAIDSAYQSLVAAIDLPGKRAAWSVLRKRVNSRSHRAVARLEQARGLVAIARHSVAA